MVAHLGCVAITLSHKFWEHVETCTKHCETRHRRARLLSLQSKTHSRKLLESNLNLGCRSSRASSHASLRFAISCQCPASSCRDEMRHYERFAAHLEPYWIQSQTFDILNTCRRGQDFRQETGAHFHAQAHISTQPASPLENAWLPLADEDQVRSSRAEPPPRCGAQARFRKCWIPRLSFPAVLFRLEQ